MAQVTPAAQLTITRASTATYVGANGTITTAAINEPRYEFDPITLNPRGLLVEQASTNLLFPSAVATTQTITVTQGLQYSISFWGTGSVVLSGGATATIQGLGDFPATRVSNTFLATSTSVVVTVTGSVTLAQFEQGMPTSYIPTTVAAVTRAADVVNVDGVRYSNNVVSGQGSMYINFEPTAAGKDSTIALSLNDGTTSNSFRIAARNSGTKINIRGNVFTPTMDFFVGQNLGLTGTNVTAMRSNGISTTEFAVNGTQPMNWAEYNGTDTVAIGGSTDTFVTTTDGGVTLVNRSLAGGFTGVVFANNRFIVAADLGFRISTNNGTSWRRVNVAGQVSQQNEIAYNGTTTLVSIGNGGSTYTSTDNGETWTSQSHAGRTNTISSITFGATLFVAAHSTGTATQAITTSPDGVTWTSRTTPSAVLFDIAYNGTTLFVAVGSGGAIITSPDAVTWTTRTSNTTNNLRGIAFGNGLWTAVGDNGVVVTSPDGTTWTVRTSVTTTSLQEVIYANFTVNPVWISVGSAGVVITSPDGITWTLRTALANAQLNGLAANSTTVVVAGGTGSLYTSTTGTTYTARANFNTSVNKIFFANNLWLTANSLSSTNMSFGYYDTSFNYTKINVTSPVITPSTVSGFNYLNGRYYILCAGYLLTSTDLVNFTIASAISTSYTYSQIVQNGDTVVVGGSNGSVLISYDNGVTFSTTAIDCKLGASFLNGLFYKDGLYIAVSLNGTISTSPDAVNWTLRLTPQNYVLRTPSYSTKENLYYVCGDFGNMWTSPDGFTWTLISNRATVNMATAGTVTFGNNLPNLNTGVNKIAVSFKTGSMSVAMNGSNVTTKTVGTLPTVNRLSYGMNGAAAMQLNGYIKDVQYFKQPLSEAELKAITL